MDRAYIEKEKNNIKKIYDVLEKNVFEDENSFAIIALSGGPDSIYLAEITYNYLLNERKVLKENISNYMIAVHVNHMIRREAKDDEILAKEFCKLRNIPFVVYSENMEREAEIAKESVETYSRNYRYDIFKKEAEKYLKGKEKNNLNINPKVSILTAHTYDDNAETIFLRLMRGTSKKGLEGIAKNTKISDNIYLVRPILNIKKENLIEYLKNNDIKYAVDKTNFETEYTRNKVRNILFKEIKDYGFDITRSLNSLSENIKEEEKYLEKELEKVISECEIELEKDYLEKKNEGKLDYKKIKIYDIDKLINYDKYIVKRVIVKTIEDMWYGSNNVTSINIEDIYMLIKNNINGKKLYPNKNILVEIERKEKYQKEEKLSNSQKVVSFKKIK